MPDIQPHVCVYGGDCRHHITLEQWAAAHPDLARQMLDSAPPQSGVARRLREALEIPAVPPVDTSTEGDMKCP